jgi:hypothetical protein
MADDLQKLVDSTLKGSLSQASSLPKEEEDEDSNLTAEEKKAKADLRKEIEKDNDQTSKQGDRGESIHPPTPQEIAEAVRLHQTRAPEGKEISAEIVPRPKTIADLLHLEAEVAKNPPKAEPAGTSKIREGLKNITVTQKTDSSILKKIRTFKTDVAEAMTTGKSTYIGIATAQLLKNKKEETSQETVIDKEKPAPPPRAPEPVFEKEPSHSFTPFFIGISLLLILSGVGGVMYIQYIKNSPISGPVTAAIASHFVPTQFETIIETEGKNASYLRSAVAAERKDAPGELNNLGNIKLVESKDATPLKELTTSDFIASFGMRPPTELLRTLDPTFILGIHRFPANQSFLIFKTDTYETARDALREWEVTTLESDVAKLLRSPSDFDLTSASSSNLVRQPFSDRVLKNKDCRVLVDKQGNVIFFYTFIDRTYIVFGSDPETLGAVLTSLASRKVTQ